MTGSVATEENSGQPLPVGLVAALVLGLFVCGLDGSVVTIMLPKLQKVFQASVSTAMLLGTVYVTLMAAFQLFFGRCADLFDSVGVFVVGVVLFGLGSLGCALSGGIEAMLVGRALQGLGASMLSASFGAVVLHRVPREKTGRIVGLVMTVMSVGSIIGPPLGGFFADHLSWQWAFAINLPLCALSLGLLLPHLRPPTGSLSQLDLAGGLLSVVMLGSLPVALTLASTGGWRSPAVVATFALFGLSAMLFVVMERRATHPLMPLGIFAEFRLTVVGSSKLLVFMCMNGVMLVFPFFMATTGMEISKAGLVMVASALTMGLTTPLAGYLVDRFGGPRIMALGALGLVCAAGASMGLGAASSPLALAGALACFGAVLALSMLSTTVQLLKLAPAGQEGIFSALNSLMVPLGGALGMALYSYLYSNGGFHRSLEGVLSCSCLFLLLALGLALAGRRDSPGGIA